MPDDNLFPEKTAEPEPTGTPPGNGKDPEGTETLTMQNVAELITQAQAPLLEKIEGLTQATSQAVTDSRQPAPTPQNQEPQGDFLTQFSENPELSIDNKIAQQLRTVAPMVSNLINSTVSNFVSRERTEIDGQFGEGAFDKFFDKPLNVLMDSYRQTNAAALADEGTIRRETDGLKGRLFDQLVEYRTENQKKTAEEGEAGTQKLVDGVLEKVVQTNMTGGIRRIDNSADAITEDLKGYLAERAAAIGVTEEPKAWLERTTYGNSYEDFQEHQKKLEAAKGDS